MPGWSEELAGLRTRLEALAEEFEALPEVRALAEIAQRAEQIGKSSSQSWLGYQANVYYRDFEEPPAGEFFDTEFGIDGSPFHGRDRNWKEAAPNDVAARILGPSGDAALGKANDAAKRGLERFEKARSEVLSILDTYLATSEDGFVSRARAEVKAVKVLDAIDIANRRSPRKHVLTQDEVALMQGTWAPPHVRVEARISAARQPAALSLELARQLDKLVTHLARVTRKDAQDPSRTGRSVFISHGRSPAWKELKGFLADQLRLACDETDRARLAQMLDAAGFAFILLTAEDDSTQARMNAIHEAGLFQGRLGFTKVVVLLEEGCEAFAHIPIGQVRFPRGNLAAKFEEIRRALQREGLVS